MDQDGNGRLSLAELQGQAEGIDTILCVFPDMYGRLVGKRLALRFFLDKVASGGMHVCDYLLACDIDMDPVPGYALTSWETGYGDFLCRPDLSTLRRAAWLPGSAIVLCDLVSETGGALVEAAPRRILQRQAERARDRGFTVMAGLEIEFYLFNETYPSARDKRYQDLKTSSPYIEDYQVSLGTREEPFLGGLRRDLEASGIPVESSKGEWGPGQQELNIVYSEALEQADRTALYKLAIRDSTQAHQKAVTFMSKWNESVAGSSMHAHVSLWNADATQNRFEGDSEIFRWFLGGWLHYARELAAFYAPNVSSYKRYQAGSFAPTTIGWSRDNRTAGFRVVGSGKSQRIECRLPGADANPYLVLAAGIAAGLQGIEERIEPPAPLTGDLYAAAGLPRVPSTLREAIAELEKSEFSRRAFGESVIEHYLHFFRTEQRKFDEVVTDWEKARYFERI